MMGHFHNFLGLLTKMITLRMTMIFAGMAWYCDTLYAETYMGRRETGVPSRDFIVRNFRANPAPLTYQEIV